MFDVYNYRKETHITNQIGKINNKSAFTVWLQPVVYYYHSNPNIGVTPILYSN